MPAKVNATRVGPQGPRTVHQLLKWLHINAHSDARSIFKAGEIRWQTRLPCVVDMRRSAGCRNLLIFNFDTILSFSLLYLLLVHTMHRRQKMSMIILHLMRDFLLVEKSERRMVCCGWTACWVCQVFIFLVSLLNVSAAQAFQEGIFTVSERLEAKPDV